MSVSPSSASIAVGGTVQLTATSQPPATVTFVWSTSNASVATVSQTGLVSGVAAGTATVSASAGGKTGSATVTVTGAPPPPPVGEILLAAGDISDCSNNNDEATATLLDGLAGTVAVLGDNAYENGSAADYADCYDPTWGRHKARTKPSIGNHEYQTANATGYYGYFGSAAGDPAKGYYSYDLGDWHVVVLNSNIARDAASSQIAWLRSDLAASAKSCTLAYWHHPRFSSGEHGNDASQQPFWDALYEFNAEVILNGHDHNYERFAPQTPTGVADASRGLREFVVGTGGRALRTLATTRANSQVFDVTSFGVIKLTLSAGSYTWQFIPIAGQSFTDSGSGTCH
ncbi:MAG: Ig-like domain-containing protein [Gemmatimonadaceae bacterium]